MSKLFLLAALFLLQVSTCVGFLTASDAAIGDSVRQSRTKPLYLSEDLPLLGEEYDTVSTESTSIFESLKERQDQLELGIGRRYVCRTRKGFLNVHKEPGEAFNPYNIVNQISEGDIVTSIGPPRGGWIRHDSGGWSIAVYNGFTWLEEMKE